METERDFRNWIREEIGWADEALETDTLGAKVVIDSIGDNKYFEDLIRSEFDVDAEDSFKKLNSPKLEKLARLLTANQNAMKRLRRNINNRPSQNGSKKPYRTMKDITKELLLQYNNRLKINCRLL